MSDIVFSKLFQEFRDKSDNSLDVLTEEELTIFCQGVAAGKPIEVMAQELKDRLIDLMQAVISDADDEADPFEEMKNNDAYDAVGKDRKNSPHG